ncbi:MAG: c-type cytochrome [Gammaproteobacteria bacterium]|nr:c-type cytochrome [Gammaproteobacteria bacterium]
MREKWARRIALLTGLLALLLAATFALIQNPTETAVITESREQPPSSKRRGVVALDPKRIEAGQQIYNQQTCSRCHSIAGQGNPRNSLDGVGTRRTALELRDWIIGADAVQAELPAYASRLKQTYRKLSGDDLDVLIIYMQSLRR